VLDVLVALRRVTEVVEQPLTGTEEDRDDGDDEVVDQAGGEVQLDG
jgi:hypothetical protein